MSYAKMETIAVYVNVVGEEQQAMAARCGLRAACVCMYGLPL